MIKIVLSIAAIGGFVLILGTAGASDFGNISTKQAVFQASIGLVLFVVGLILLEEVIKNE